MNPEPALFFKGPPHGGLFMATAYSLTDKFGFTSGFYLESGSTPAFRGVSWLKAAG